MGLENWGEWAAIGVFLAVGFALLYAKVSSIITRIDGLVLQMEKDYDERLRMWGRLDEQGKEITRITAELDARK